MTGHLCPGPGDDHRDHRLRDTLPLESRPVEESLAAFEVALSVPSPGPARLPPLTADAHETRGDGAWRTPRNGARRCTGVPAGPTQLPQQPWQNGRQAHRMRTPEDSRGFRGVSPSATSLPHGVPRPRTHWTNARTSEHGLSVRGSRSSTDYFRSDVHPENVRTGPCPLEIHTEIFTGRTPRVCFRKNRELGRIALGYGAWRPVDRRPLVLFFVNVFCKHLRKYLL